MDVRVVCKLACLKDKLREEIHSKIDRDEIASMTDKVCAHRPTSLLGRQTASLDRSLDIRFPFNQRTVVVQTCPEFHAG